MPGKIDLSLPSSPEEDAWVNELMQRQSLCDLAEQVAAQKVPETKEPDGHPGHSCACSDNGCLQAQLRRTQTLLTTIRLMCNGQDSELGRAIADLISLA